MSHKTAYRRKIEAKWAAVYQDYNKLIAEPGAMATAVESRLMKKHGYHTRSAIYTIISRMKAQERFEGLCEVASQPMPAPQGMSNPVENKAIQPKI